jgi:hypothetical protein
LRTRSARFKRPDCQSCTFQFESLRTNAAVTRRTKGKTSSIVGKATIHDKAQEPNHNGKNPAENPAPRKVLIKDTTQVMMKVKTKGINTAA